MSDTPMHAYRTHNCGQLRDTHVGRTVRLSGWVHRVRDHGGLVFVDLRDHYGLTQLVTDVDAPAFRAIDGLRAESVVTVTGRVVARAPATVNAGLATGAIEVRADEVVVQSAAAELPLPVAGDTDYPEELRLKYRYLDLRRERIHRNIVLRSNVIASLRRRMIDQGFTEFQTPILTASSPEGARDFLVPSRVHPGKFYALPQAPQMFKQLLMVAGFDRYFQIAPCFRDEDARADRSPGEFYQLDLEMSFVTQDDVFAALEPVLGGVFAEFAGWNRETPWSVTPAPFPRIAYADAMLRYGSDKPDLRNPIEIVDVTEHFRGSQADFVRKAIEAGAVVRAIKAPISANVPRSFFVKLDEWAKLEGFGGLGYVKFGSGLTDVRGETTIKQSDGSHSRIAATPILEISPSTFVSGSFSKVTSIESFYEIAQALSVSEQEGVCFVVDKPTKAARLAGLARTRIAEQLGLIEGGVFKFCWIVDFPMYEADEDTGKIDFSHNPFSMPQGGLEALETQDPLDVLAYQYDIVCNGVELSSGAIRNHLPEIMYRAFGIAGYAREDVDRDFAGMIGAFKFGAPPHGGSAPGVDRMVMLLADEPNLREVVLFPMNQRAEDLMMGAPSTVAPKQLRELHIRLADAKPS